MSAIHSQISRGTRNIKRRVAGVAMMSFVFTALCATSAPAFAQIAQTPVGAGLSTGLISLSPGQSVRLSVVNVGGKVVHGESILVPVADRGGKWRYQVAPLSFAPSGRLRRATRSLTSFLIPPALVAVCSTRRSAFSKTPAS